MTVPQQQGVPSPQPHWQPGLLMGWTALAAAAVPLCDSVAPIDESMLARARLEQQGFSSATSQVGAHILLSEGRRGTGARESVPAQQPFVGWAQPALHDGILIGIEGKAEACLEHTPRNKIPVGNCVGLELHHRNVKNVSKLEGISGHRAKTYEIHRWAGGNRSL